MKNKGLKLNILFLITIITIGSLMAQKTYAYFSAIEKTNGKKIQTEILDLYLIEPQTDGTPNSVTPSTPYSTNITLANNGDPLIHYSVKAMYLTSNSCDVFNIKAELEGELKYEGSLIDFVDNDLLIDFSPEQDDWLFTFAFVGEEPVEEVSCSFDITFRGWQKNITFEDLPDSPELPSGFSDFEKTNISLNLTADLEIDLEEEIEPTSTVTVVLNEFLPDPEGDEKSLDGLEGEWVEIYNTSTGIQDITDWYIKDASGHLVNIISASNPATIGAKGSGSEWRLIFLNKAILNNTRGETVKLYSSTDELIDSYSYVDVPSDNKSYGRFPDGTGEWVKLIPTPNQKNENI